MTTEFASFLAIISSYGDFFFVLYRAGAVPDLAGVVRDSGCGPVSREAAIGAGWTADDSRDRAACLRLDVPPGSGQARLTHSLGEVIQWNNLSMIVLATT